MTRNTLQFVVIVLGSFLIGTAHGQDSEAEAALADAKSKWEAVTESDGPLEYMYGYSTTSLDGTPDLSLLIYVDDKVVTDVRPIYYGTETFDPEPFDLDTVEGLFDFIEQSLNNDTVTSVDAEYDPTYGYPTVITIKTDETSATGGPEGVGTVYRIEPMTIYTVLQNDLDMYWGVWNESGISDYEYTAQLSCFCTPFYRSPKQITVLDGEIVDITDVESGNSTTDYYPPTIDGLFESVQLGIDEKHYIVNVQFDSTYGFVSFLYNDVDPGIADEEVGYNITNFIDGDSNSTLDIESDNAESSSGELDSQPENGSDGGDGTTGGDGTDSQNVSIEDTSGNDGPNSVPSSPTASPVSSGSTMLDKSSATRISMKSRGTFLAIVVGFYGLYLV